MLWKVGKTKVVQYKLIRFYFRSKQIISNTFGWTDSVALTPMLLYLKHSEGERVCQVVMGGQQHFTVVSI